LTGAGSVARRSLIAAMAMAILAACAGATPSSTPDPSRTPVQPSEPGAAPTAQDVMGIAKMAPLAPGTYFIDPDSDPSTPLHVVYDVPAEGWSQWFGAVKFVEDGHVVVNITTVVNVVRDGCHDHAWADPPVGPTVDDLAVALADLAPFRVAVGPNDVTRHGYRGKYLELTAPDLPVEAGDFTGCIDNNLSSWVAPIDVAEREGGAFHAYNAEPVEAFWILDVDGARLVIEANWSIDSPPAALAEMRAILDSIRLEP
jgi:hypothetical protein